MLHDAMQLHAQRNLLMSAERKLRALHGFCEGCDCPASRCGPVLWKEQRKCCPDCTHEVARG
jgi:hypothetical protein